MTRPFRLALLAAALTASASPTMAEGPKGFLETIRRHTVVTSTVPDNGDQNPYAIVVAPVSAGVIQKDDVLVTNFNNSGNLQGLARRSCGSRRERGS